jgi:hypothetical protein
MRRYLRSMKAIPTRAGIVLAILTIPIQLTCQNGQESHSSAVQTQSSTSKPENRTPQTDSYVPCDDVPSSAKVKSSTTAGTVVKPHRVDLSWKASTSPGVAKYNVHRCSPGAPCTASTSVITSVTGTGYIDTQVQPSHAYCYFVTAVGAGRPDSIPSNIVHVVIPSP